MNELLQLPREDIEEKLAIENPSKREKELATIMSGYLLMQDCNDGIVNIHQLMEEEMWAEARNALQSLRTQMLELKGSAIVKEYLTRYQQELVKLEKDIADRKKEAKKKAKELADEEARITDDDGSNLPVIITTIIIVAVWIAKRRILQDIYPVGD